MNVCLFYVTHFLIHASVVRAHFTNEFCSGHNITYFVCIMPQTQRFFN